MRVAVTQAAVTFAADRRDGQDAGQDRAGSSADTVNAECIEAVVIAERVLEARRAPVAQHTRDDTDDQRAFRIDKARSGRDRHKPGNRAGDDAEDARFALD